jgi:hypothetical protein
MLKKLAVAVCCGALVAVPAVAEAHKAPAHGHRPPMGGTRHVVGSPTTADAAGRKVAHTRICHPVYSVTGQEGWVCYYTT